MDDIINKTLKNDKIDQFDDELTLGWLKLYLISSDRCPSSKTVYIKRNEKIYAVLHTDTSGATKCICLPAEKENGTLYFYYTDTGETNRIIVYPFVVNIHYIDKNTEEK